jgi:hypothetical protein
MFFRLRVGEGGPALLLVLLAPFDPTQKGRILRSSLIAHTLLEFLSKEQNEIKRSLFNLGLMVDIMNKQTASIGFSWRSTKLTKVLPDLCREVVA